jgi:UDP-glucose 4-epimerase
MQEPKTWIVAGASGRIGRMVMNNWRQHAPNQIQFVPQFRSDHSTGLHWNLAEGPQPLLDWTGKNGPAEGLIVLSGVRHHEGDDPSENTAIIKSAIEAAKRAGFTRMLVASSSAVYGAWSDAPYKETMPLKPVTAYGRSKADVEALCNQASSPDLAITCLRIGNVAGADALLGSNFAVPIKLDQFHDGKGPKRSYIGPQTLADVLVTLVNAERPLPEVLNIAAPKPVLMQALLEAAKWPWQFVPAPSSAQQSVLLDTGLLSSLYDFKTDAANPIEIIRQWHALRDAL